MEINADALLSVSSFPPLGQGHLRCGPSSYLSLGKDCLSRPRNLDISSINSPYSSAPSTRVMEEALAFGVRSNSDNATQLKIPIRTHSDRVGFLCSTAFGRVNYSWLIDESDLRKSFL